MYWYSRVYPINNATFYVADQYSVYKVVNKTRSRVAGMGTPGFRNGDALNSLFNNITSVVFY